VVGYCEYGDEPSGSGATELVSYEGLDKLIFRYGKCLNRLGDFVEK
jgi:hypothetical protein